MTAHDATKDQGNPGGNGADPLRLVLSKVKNPIRSGARWMARCPAHDDRKASLSIMRGNTKPVVFNCFAGCKYDDIKAALGLTDSQLNPNGSSNTRKAAPIIAAIYPYRDADGKFCYEKVRFEPKKFAQRRYDSAANPIWARSAGWYDYKSWGVKAGYYKCKDKDGNPLEDPQARPHGATWFDECPSLIYGLPELKAAGTGSRVYSFEGEKARDRFHRRFAMQIAPGASVAIGGATAWRQDFAKDFAGHELIIFPDNDDQGREMASDQARDCYPHAKSIKIVRLTGVPRKGDMFDWLDAGHTWNELQAIIDQTSEYEPPVIEQPEELESVEEEGDDPAIVSDPDREKYLRQLARNTSKVMDAVGLLLGILGFKEDHSRLLNALIITARDRLGTVIIKQDWLARKYPRGGMSVSTVARDIAKLCDEQVTLGVTVLGYTPGTYNPEARQGYASKFNLYFLRYALKAISLAIDTKGQSNYSYQALQEACERIAKEVPRYEPARSVKEEKKERAEIRAESQSGRAISEQARMRIRKELRRFFEDHFNAGFSLEEAVAFLEEEYLDAQSEAARATEESQVADYSTLSPITHDKERIAATDFPAPNAKPGPDPLPYSQQNDDYRERIAKNSAVVESTTYNERPKTRGEELRIYAKAYQSDLAKNGSRKYSLNRSCDDLKIVIEEGPVGPAEEILKLQRRREEIYARASEILPRSGEKLFVAPEHSQEVIDLVEELDSIKSRLNQLLTEAQANTKQTVVRNIGQKVQGVL